MKTKLTLLPLFIVAILANSPAKPGYFDVKASSDPYITDMSNIAIEEGEAFDVDNIFYDDFSSNTLDANWTVSHRKWGGFDNKGVVADNVMLNTSDDTVIIRAQGNQHIENSTVNGLGGPLSGGAIVLKDTVRPGRFEVRMKTTYRVGACTAFWTYTEDSSANNHEIDIELPPMSNGNNVYDEVLFTNWVSGNKTEQSQPKLDYHLNDGEYHTYAFDWYYSDRTKQIDYYVDGVKLATHDDVRYVPYLGSKLWVGVWIPNNPGFVGIPNFDTSYMEIDYVKYSPFLDQDPLTKGPSGSSGNSSLAYKKVTQTPTYEWISNGTFHSIAKNSSLESRGYSVSGEARLSNNYGYGDTSTSGGVKIYESSSISYKIDSTAPKFKYRLSSNIKGSGEISLNFYNRGGMLINTTNYSLNFLEDWGEFIQEFEIPDTTFHTVLKITTSPDDELLADNISMYLIDEFSEDNPGGSEPGTSTSSSSSSSSTSIEPNSSSTSSPSSTSNSPSSNTNSNNESKENKNDLFIPLTYIGLGSIGGASITALIFLIVLLSKKNK